MRPYAVTAAARSARSSVSNVTAVESLVAAPALRSAAHVPTAVSRAVI